MLIRKVRRIELVLAGIVLVSSSALAEEVSFRQGVNGYSGARDVEIKGGEIPIDSFPKPGSEADAPKKKPEKPAPHPKPTEPTISVDVDSDFQQSQALIRFDNIIGTASGQIPPGSTVTAAVLKLHVTSGGGDRVFIHRLLADWNPETLTWDTCTLGGNTEPGLQADNKEAAAPFTTFDSTKKGEYEINILPLVKLWVAGTQKNYGLAFTCSSANGWDFATSEAENVEHRPMLVVTYTTPAASAK